MTTDPRAVARRRARAALRDALLILVVIACLALFAAASRAAAPADELGPVREAVVLSVHDGDTFRAGLMDEGGVIYRRINVRVALIDAPEVPNECYGDAATRNARRVLRVGRVVGLQTYPPAGTRSYGRAVRVVRILETGRTFERWMLSYGYANGWHFNGAAFPYASWESARRVAIRHHRGAWGVCPGPTGHGPTYSESTGWQTGPAPTPTMASTYGLGDGLLGSGLACRGVLDYNRPVVATRGDACGTKLRVCYRRCVIAVRDDYGPAAWTGRDIDLGPAAAATIGFAGVGPVRVSPARPTARLGVDRYAHGGS